MKLLTVEDVAALAQVHPKTVRRAIQAGLLVASRPGGPRGQYRITEQAVADWVAATIASPVSYQSDRSSVSMQASDYGPAPASASHQGRLTVPR